MNCSIISIGTELNLGLTSNSNATFIARKLSEAGIDCKTLFTVKDNMEDIIHILHYAMDSSDSIIISGGLGPTDDDMTREAVSKALGLKLFKDNSLDGTSLRFLRDRLTEDLKKRLLRQSYIPYGATPIVPRVGSASGFMVETNRSGQFIFVIPGVPREMEDMLIGDLLPFLRKNLIGSTAKIKESVLLTTDISESEIEQKIKDLYAIAKKINVSIGITAVPGIIKVIIISSSSSEQTNAKNIKMIEEMLNLRIGQYIYGRNNETLSYALKKAILKKNKNITISAAESLTGGLLGKMITDTQGSSDYFKGSIVSYSNDAKKKILNVDRERIKTLGSVSSSVCYDMALHAKKIFESDFSVAVTGFAGPDKSNDQTGLVFSHIIGPGSINKSYEKIFKGNREDIRFRTAQFVLNQLRIEIENM